MDAVEFRPIAADLQARWYAFPIPRVGLEQYVRDLHDLEAGDVAAAVTAFSVEGTDRPPTAGQIRRKIAEMQLDVPAWDEVRTALVRWRRGRDDREALVAAWKCPHDACDGTGRTIGDRGDGADAFLPCRCAKERTAVRRGLDTLPPLVAEFVTEGHVLPAELDRMISAGDAKVDEQVMWRWREFKHRVIESRVLATLPDGSDLPRIAAARQENAERSERHGEPRRFDRDRIAGMLERGAA